MIATRCLVIRRRPGFGLVEMAITGALIVTGMVATVQVVGWVARERRAVERRERAVLEAANLMERINARSWPDLTSESLATIHLSKSVDAFLPRAKLDLTVTELADAPVRKKIVLQIRWSAPSGGSESPVRLVKWTHRPEGEAR